MPRLGKYLILVFLLTLITACKPQTNVNLGGEHWVVFSAEHAQQTEIGKWLFSDNVEYWTPAEADIRAVENGVGAFLQKNESAFYTDTPVWERLDDYNRQYIGIVADGKQIIYANYFCAFSENWKQEFVFVADGGACYFQFQYDVERDEFMNLQVNGEA